MKNKWIVIKSLLGILVLSFLVSFSAIRHARKPVKDISVRVDHESGKYFVNDSLVKKLLDNKEIHVSSIPLGDLNINHLEKALDRNSFIRKAEVFQDIDGVMKININQETPIARINTGTNEYYLSENLTEIPLSNLYAAKVVLVGGNIVKSDFAGLKELATEISADKLLKKHIIAIKKEKPNSFILLVNKGNYVIEFGELKDFKAKFDKLKLFYEQYLGKVGWNYYEKINLKFNNQIVATKRNSDEE